MISLQKGQRCEWLFHHPHEVVQVFFLLWMGVLIFFVFRRKLPMCNYWPTFCRFYNWYKHDILAYETDDLSLSLFRFIYSKNREYLWWWSLSMWSWKLEVFVLVYLTTPLKNLWFKWDPLYVTSKNNITWCFHLLDAHHIYIEPSHCDSFPWVFVYDINLLL